MNLRTTSMKKLLAAALTVLLVVLLTAQPVLASAEPDFSVANLMTEYTVDPLGIDVKQPGFTWQMRSDTTGKSQSAYQIVVKCGDDTVWDSGKVDSGYSVNIPYEGKPLEGSTRYTWHVTVWDETGRQQTSDEASFETALMDLGWDGALCLQTGKESNDVAPMFRKEFEVGKDVASARLYASAAGIYEAYLNGEKVGDGFFNPGWTDYMDNVNYECYDVTDMLQPGANAIGAMLGEGWYSGDVSVVGEDCYGADEDMAFIAKLVITYTDGTKDVIVTDGSWSACISGPVRQNNFLDGEKYDANYEIDGWNEPGFKEDQEWFTASPTDTVENIGAFTAHVGNQVEIVEEFTPISVNKVTRADGEEVFIYDFGQNFAGFASIRITGEQGTTVSMRYGEMLNDGDDGDTASGEPGYRGGDDNTGTLYDANLRTFHAIDSYTLKGDPAGESYMPRFTYHGFRYMELTGLDEPLPLEDVTGIALSNCNETGVSAYETSNALVNQLVSNVFWSQRSNFIAVPTDCPQRDERMGWTGDTQVFARTSTYNYNADQFYNGWMHTMSTSTDEEGHVAYVAPAKNIIFYGMAANGWSDAIILLPWQVYQQYADKTIIEENYDAMTRYAEYLETTDWKGGGFLGDMDETTYRELVNHAFTAHSLEILSKMAAVIGRDDDAAKYAAAAEQSKASWRELYVTEDGDLLTPTQTSYLMALAFDLLEEDQRPMIERLLTNDVEDHDNHLTTGFMGTYYLPLTLSAIGETEVAYALLEQETNPSWLYSVLTGATTTWEGWNAYTLENGLGGGSFNHFLYGAVYEWMIRYSLGIERDESEPGYKHILLQPAPGGTLTYAKGHYDSVYGTIESSWERVDADSENCLYSFTVPANTTATLYLMVDGTEPTVDADIDGVTYEGMAEHNGQNVSVFTLASGSYSFVYADGAVQAAHGDASPAFMEILQEASAAVDASEETYGASQESGSAS